MKKHIFTAIVLTAILASTALQASEVIGWGNNDYGQCNVPEPNTDFVAVAAGYNHSLGLKSDGSLVAWGYNGNGRCDVPDPNTGFVAVAAGSGHSLGLKSDGSIVAFGNNGDGQCTVPDPNTSFVAVAAGNSHSLGLKSDGSIVAWGWNNFGQRNVPEPNTSFVAVAAGYGHSLGLKSDGSIVAWGWNDYAQCDVPDPNTGFVAVAAGGYHSLGLKSDGSIMAWGDNGAGQCDVPDPNTGFVAVAAGFEHSLGLKSDGSIVAWGWNDDGQCDVPDPNTGFVAVAAGYGHSLGLKREFTLSISKTGNGSVKVNGTLRSLPWSGTFTVGTNVTLEAVADSNWQFSNWSGDLSGSTNPTSIQMDGDKSVTANFTSSTPPCKFGSFDSQKNAKLTLQDCNYNDVTFSLSGPGYGEIDCEDCNFSLIALYNTNEKSGFTIKTKGKTETSVGNIISDGPLKSITAKTTDLRGDITINGSLGMLTLDDVADGHMITIGPSANPKAGVLMKFDEVNDLTINSDMPIKTLSATDWVGESINAPSAGSIMVKGDKKRGIPGDLDVDVTLKGGTINSVRVAGILSGAWTCDAIKSISAMNIVEAALTLTQEPNDKILALGKLTAKGWITDSQILSSGNIGTVTAGAVQNSSCFAGVTATRDLDADGVLDLPDPNADIDYVDPAAIKSIKISGIKGEQYCVINSNIAAARILSAYLADPNTSNSGVVFGIAADYIKALKIKDDTGIHSYKDLDEPSVLTFDDAEIRLH